MKVKRKYYTVFFIHTFHYHISPTQVEKTIFDNLAFLHLAGRPRGPGGGNLRSQRIIIIILQNWPYNLSNKSS